MNKLVLYTQYYLYKNNIRPKAFFSREIQLSEANPAKSSICYMDNIGYNQYWLQVWWQGIFFAWGPPNARKIVIFTFSIEHPFFWPNSKANKTIYKTYIQPIHIHALYTIHKVIIMRKSHTNPMGSGRHGNFLGDVID